MSRETVSVSDRGVGELISLAPARLSIVLAGHTAVDVYAAFVPPILLVLGLRASLTEAQQAWLLGIGSLASGLSQPAAAWLSDRIDSRLFAALGLVIAAVCLSGIGIADTFGELALLYGIGMMGVGIFHPIGAASIGQIAQVGLRGRRSLGLSLFFVAGMAGGVIGSMVAPRVTALGDGFKLLALLMIPGVVVGLMLHGAIRRIPHRDQEHRAIQFSREEIRTRWFMVGLLWFGNAVRFTVNLALIYLAVRWARAVTARARPELEERALVEAAAPLGGDLLAMMIVGMAIGGLCAGTLVRPGTEKRPLVLVPIIFAPAVLVFPHAGVFGAYVLAIVLGIGFASMVPVTMALAQRLLPHRTSLASGLMLGGAWAVAIIGPRAAEFCLRGWELSLESTFALTAALLALSGLISIPLRRAVLRAAVERSAR